MTPKEYAYQCHIAINQTYGDYPYTFHLDMVVKIADKFIHLIPAEDRKEVIDGCWVHDVFEDTGKTFNNIAEAIGEMMAEYSYALATEKGKTRAERANHKYYKGISEYRYATFVKLCDRYANMLHSLQTKNSMFEKYKKEMKHFKLELFDGRFEELWLALEELAYKN
jgi:(p)ppGpp synthase/HD superfamily hydrolase